MPWDSQAVNFAALAWERSIWSEEDFCSSQMCHFPPFSSQPQRTGEYSGGRCPDDQRGREGWLLEGATLLKLSKMQWHRYVSFRNFANSDFHIKFSATGWLMHSSLKMAKNDIGSLVVLKPGDKELIAGILTERGTSKLWIPILSSYHIGLLIFIQNVLDSQYECQNFFFLMDELGCWE